MASVTEGNRRCLGVLSPLLCEQPLRRVARRFAMPVREVSPSRQLYHWTCALGPTPRIASLSKQTELARLAILVGRTDGISNTAFINGLVADDLASWAVRDMQPDGSRTSPRAREGVVMTRLLRSAVAMRSFGA